jgi:hypothetical protein
MNRIASLVIGFALAVAGCANSPTASGGLSSPITVGASPEAQIKTGADDVKVATVTATVALRNHVITVTQAKSYRNMLAAADEALKDANTDLLACRAATGSTSATSPDPCWPKVSDVITLALDSIAGVKKTLDAK